MSPELKILLAAYLLIINLILFAAMGADKARARRGLRRVTERTLFTLCLLGGGLGGVLGMKAFRHKTRHRKFALGFPLILAGWCVLLWLLMFNKI